MANKQVKISAADLVEAVDVLAIEEQGLMAKQKSVDTAEQEVAKLFGLFVGVNPTYEIWVARRGEFIEATKEAHGLTEQACAKRWERAAKAAGMTAPKSTSGAAQAKAAQRSKLQELAAKARQAIESRMRTEGVSATEACQALLLNTREAPEQRALLAARQAIEDEAAKAERERARTLRADVVSRIKSCDSATLVAVAKVLGIDA